MSSRPSNVSYKLALRAADAARLNSVEEDLPAQSDAPIGLDTDVLFEEPTQQVMQEAPPAPEPAREAEEPVEEAASPPRRGRPRGKRPVEARQTIYLDKDRHAALARIAEDRGRSVHSLILEGIDYVIQKPVKPGWQ